MKGIRKDGIQISLYITRRQKEEIERIALKRDMSQHHIIRMMLELGIDCHKDLERIGLIKAIDFSYYVKHAVKEKIASNGPKQTSFI